MTTALIENAQKKTNKPIFTAVSSTAPESRAWPRDSAVHKHLCCCRGGRRVQVELFSLLTGREAGVLISMAEGSCSDSEPVRVLNEELLRQKTGCDSAVVPGCVCFAEWEKLSAVTKLLQHKPFKPPRLGVGPCRCPGGFYCWCCLLCTHQCTVQGWM